MKALVSDEIDNQFDPEKYQQGDPRSQGIISDSAFHSKNQEQMFLRNGSLISQTISGYGHNYGFGAKVED